MIDAHLATRSWMSQVNYCRVPHPFRALCEKGGIPPPSRAWDFPSLTTRLFHHIFLVQPSQTPNRNRVIIHRQYSIENCARLQRRTQNPPQIMSAGSLKIRATNTQISSRSGDPAPRQVHAKSQKHQLSPYSCS